MNSNTAIRAVNISKQYRLGEGNDGVLSKTNDIGNGGVKKITIEFVKKLPLFEWRQKIKPKIEISFRPSFESFRIQLLFLAVVSKS